MPRMTPDSQRTIDAISDARRELQNVFLGNDGRICPQEEGVLLLLDTAAYSATRTDLNRRVRHNLDDYGRVSPRLQREIAEAERDFAHVIGIHAA